eukprot:2852781-Amphidinium_carterae.1
MQLADMTHHATMSLSCLTLTFLGASKLKARLAACSALKVESFLALRATRSFGYATAWSF